MAAIIEPLDDMELIYVAALVGIDACCDCMSALTTSQLSVYYRNAQKALLRRRFPFGYSEEEKSVALEEYQFNVDRAFVDMWNKIGADNESHHSEAGVSRSYLNFESYFHDVVPVAKVL